jgi:serine/threonine protein kinase
MTLRYASPEQLNRTLSGRSSDLYALGVIAYELVTGHHPYGRELKKGVSSLVQAQTTRRPVPASVAKDPEEDNGLPARLRQLPIRFRANVDQLLSNALETAAARRYRTAAQFLDDVRLCLEDRTVSARSLRTVSPLRPAQN